MDEKGNGVHGRRAALKPQHECMLVPCMRGPDKHSLQGLHAQSLTTQIANIVLRVYDSGQSLPAVLTSSQLALSKHRATRRKEHVSTCHLVVARTGRHAHSTLHSACGVAPTAKETLAGG